MIQVADRISESKYHRLNVNLQKSVMLIILRSQKPDYLRASIYFKLKLSGFTWFMRTSYSLFTLLENVYDFN